MKQLLNIFNICVHCVIAILLSCQVSFASKLTKEEISKIIISESYKSKSVKPEIALAVAEIESSFRPDVISPKGAVGVMQIMPLTAKSVFNVPRYQLFDPEVNIRLGVQFLDQLIEKYDGEIHFALSHYNGGSKVGNSPNLRIIPATKPYVKKVLIAAKRHQKLLANLDAPTQQQPREYASRGQLKITGKNLETSLKEAEYWLNKAKMSGYRKGYRFNKNNSELKRLHQKMEDNRKVFRQFLENG